MILSVWNKHIKALHPGLYQAKITHQIQTEEVAGLLDGFMIASFGEGFGRRGACDGLGARPNGATARSQFETAPKCRPSASRVPTAPHGLNERRAAVTAINALQF